MDSIPTHHRPSNPLTKETGSLLDEIENLLTGLNERLTTNNGPSKREEEDAQPTDRKTSFKHASASEVSTSTSETEKELVSMLRAIDSSIRLAKTDGENPNFVPRSAPHPELYYHGAVGNQVPDQLTNRISTSVEEEMIDQVNIGSFPIPNTISSPTSAVIPPPNFSERSSFAAAGTSRSSISSVNSSHHYQVGGSQATSSNNNNNSNNQFFSISNNDDSISSNKMTNNNDDQDSSNVSQDNIATANNDNFLFDFLEETLKLYEDDSTSLFLQGSSNQSKVAALNTDFYLNAHIEPIASPVSPISPDSLNAQMFVKRAMVIKELLESEREYVSDLAVLVFLFLDPLQDVTWLSSEKKQLVIRNTHEILKFQRKFLKALEKACIFTPSVDGRNPSFDETSTTTNTAIFSMPSEDADDETPSAESISSQTRPTITERLYKTVSKEKSSSQLFSGNAASSSSSVPNPSGPNSPFILRRKLPIFSKQSSSNLINNGVGSSSNSSFTNLNNSSASLNIKNLAKTPNVSATSTHSLGKGEPGSDSQNSIHENSSSITSLDASEGASTVEKPRPTSSRWTRLKEVMKNSVSKLDLLAIDQSSNAAPSSPGVPHSASPEYPVAPIETFMKSLPPPSEIPSELNGESQIPAQICKCFISFIPQFEVYFSYCVKQDYAMAVVKEFQVKRQDFITNVFLKRLKTRLELADYFIKPVQRICKYPILLKELLKHFPKNPTLPSDIEMISLVKSALTAMEKLLARLNARKKQFEVERKTADFFFSISSFPECPSPKECGLIIHNQNVLISEVHFSFALFNSEVNISNSLSTGNLVSPDGTISKLMTVPPSSASSSLTSLSGGGATSSVRSSVNSGGKPATATANNYKKLELVLFSNWLFINHLSSQQQASGTSSGSRRKVRENKYLLRTPSLSFYYEKKTTGTGTGQGSNSKFALNHPNSASSSTDSIATNREVNSATCSFFLLSNELYRISRIKDDGNGRIFHVLCPSAKDVDNWIVQLKSLFVKEEISPPIPFLSINESSGAIKNGSKSNNEIFTIAETTTDNSVPSDAIVRKSTNSTGDSRPFALLDLLPSGSGQRKISARKSAPDLLALADDNSVNSSTSSKEGKDHIKEIIDESQVVTAKDSATDYYFDFLDDFINNESSQDEKNAAKSAKGTTKTTATAGKNKTLQSSKSNPAL